MRKDALERAVDRKNAEDLNGRLRVVLDVAADALCALDRIRGGRRGAAPCRCRPRRLQR